MESRGPKANELAEQIPTSHWVRAMNALRVHSRGGLDDPSLCDALTEAYRAAGNSTGPLTASAPTMAYGLLKVLLEDAKGWPRWQAIEADDGFEGPWQREDAVRAIWSRLDDDAVGTEYIETTFYSLSFHRHRIFEWLLSRYQLALARTIWQTQPNRLIAMIHVPLFFAILIVLVIREVVERRVLHPAIVELAGGLLSPAVLVGVLYAIAVGAQCMAFRRRCANGLEALAVSIQSLIPRLGAAAVVGALALASSEELLEFVVNGHSEGRLALLTTIGLLYVAIEMFRRLQPLPSITNLARLTGGVAVTAFAHSLSLALVIEPGLRQILDQAPTFTGLQRLNVAAFLFMIGLTVNLIWSEEAVTQPL